MTGRGVRPDLRLAGVAVGAWVAALAVLYSGAVVGALLATGATLAAGAGAVRCRLGAPRLPRPHTCLLGLFRRERVLAWGARWSSGGLVLVGVLLGVACGAAVTAARVATRDAPALAALAAARATVEADLVVQDDPHAARGTPGRMPVYVVPAELHRVGPAAGPALRLSVGIVVLGTDPAWRTVLPGQSIVVSGRLSPARGGDLRAATLSVPEAPRLVGQPPWYQRAAGVLRTGLQRACAPLPVEPGGLLPGLVIGDTSRLDPALVEDFRTTGLTHLTAVSGSNVAIVAGAVLLLVRWSRLGPRLAAGLGTAAVVGFVVLARPSPSVLRAAVMGGLGLLALGSARHRATLPALCASVLVLVLVDPELAGDAGFALSVLATGGLVLLAPGWRDALRARRVPPGLAEALAVPAAAQVACAPVIAGISGSVSLVAVPANLLAVPAVAPATILGVVAAVLSPLWPAGAQGVAWLGQWPARWLVAVAHHGARVPSGELPWLPGAVGGLLLAAVLVAGLLAIRRPAIRRLVAVVAAAAVLGAVPVQLVAGGWPPAGWLAVACAVGQGDAIVLPVAAGQAVVVDAGPEPLGVDRCLRSLAVDAVPLLVITHFHADHVGGIAGVFRGRTVGGVVTPSWPEPATGRTVVQQAATANGVPVREIGVDWAWAAGPLRLAVLGPPHPISGTRSDPNNNSLVVRVAIGPVTVLLAGDAEEVEQAAVLGAYGPVPLAVDVLKVAHHGSSYQDIAFLDAVRPRLALVSVGVGNPYGHPNSAVLDRLGRGGARVVRTDTAGDVAAVLIDGRLAVVTHPP